MTNDFSWEIEPLVVASTPPRRWVHSSQERPVFDGLSDDSQGGNVLNWQVLG